MHRRTLLAGLSAGLGFVLIPAGMATMTVPAHATVGGVVISEIMYHAPNLDAQGAALDDAGDFIELTNAAGTPIDLSDAVWTAGVTGTIPAGTVVAPGGRIVVANDAARFQSLYGFAPDATYGDKLKNSSETVTLADSGGTVLDSVTYFDSAPWPGAADGGGSSLELRGLSYDPGDAASWGASTVVGGTPRAVNSIEGTTPLPTIYDVAPAPARPTPNQAVTVTAKLPVGSTATLAYKVMFGTDVVVPFLDDAASPGGADDGQYAATIPGQAAGNLIRYRIDASRNGVAFSYPAAGDSISYHGVVVTSPSVTSNLPVIEWFMADSVYNDLLANHRYDDVTGAATLAYNGTVWDGVQMSIRGNSSRSSPKPHWKVEMPKGYSFDMGSLLPYPLDEFALQHYNTPFSDVAWNTVAAGGARGLTNFATRTQKNGQFWGVTRLMETEDGTWRDHQGVSDWAIYKADGGGMQTKATAAALQASGWLEKKERKDEDFSDVWGLTQQVNKSASATQKAWLLQNTNVPELINYLALNMIMRNHDSGWYNWFVARDTEGTGRWELWHWDLNWTFNPPSEDGRGEFLTVSTNRNRFSDAILAYPDFKAMYFRRLRTLADQLLPAPRFENMWDGIVNPYLSDWNLDRAKWGGGSASSARSRFVAGLADRRNVIANNTGPGKPVPASQSASPAIDISNVVYDPPQGADARYVELRNPSSTESVDLSGWTISELGLTIQPGTVLLPGGTAVFAANDRAYTAAIGHGTTFVAGEFPGQLTADYHLTLRAGTRVVAVATPSGPASPVASFTSSCTGLVCGFDASGSTTGAAGGLTYQWTFGDNATASGVQPSHTYASSGQYPVTLTVTDTLDRTASVTQQVSATASQSGDIAWVGAAGTNGNVSSARVTIPTSVSAGDGLVLTLSMNSTSVTPATPAGWTLVGQAGPKSMATRVYTRTATAGDGGSTVTVAYTGGLSKTAVDLVAYRGVRAGAFLTATSTVFSSSGTARAAPAVTVPTAGSWVVSWWTDKTSATTKSWAVPGSVTTRRSSFGTGGGAISSVLGDSAGPVAAGPYAARTASSNAASNKAVAWTMVLAPA